MHLQPSFASLVTAALTLTAAAAAQETTCHNYVILSIRGTYELQGRSIAFQSMINDTFAAIPDGIEYDVVYPAAANQTAYLGADDATRYINAGLQNCPDQSYAILGYSQGASATKLTLANITDPSSPAYKAIKAVLVVGNPYHVPNASVNIDQNGGSSTRMYAGSEYNPANASDGGIADIYYHNGELLDICHTEDVVCAPKYPNASFVPGHLHYGDQDVQELGAKFLISRLGGNGTSGGSNATSSAGSGSSTTGSGMGQSSSSPEAYTGDAMRTSMSLVAGLASVLAWLL